MPLPKPTPVEQDVLGTELDFAPIDSDVLANQPVIATGDEPPKRRRGRPPGSKNRTSAGSTSSRNLEKEIGAFLFTVNAPLMMIPALQRDALDNVEIEALAKAIDQECRQNAKFRKYVETALKGMGVTNLAGVVLLIVGRRAIRHNLIPVDQIPGGQEGAAAVDMLMGQGIAMMAGKGAISAAM